MLELLLCSSLTLLPDFLYRRFVQGKRLGREITLYSVWYELRYGIVGCLLLTVLLITTIFYFHPSTRNAISYFRTIPILPEKMGRVEEVFVGLNERVTTGQKLFTLDASDEEAELETAKKRVAEVDAAIVLAGKQLKVAEAQVIEARSAYQQAVDELATRTEIRARNADTVSQREIERLQNIVDGRLGGVAAAEASVEAARAQIDVSLPAQKETALASLKLAEVELQKMTISASMDGSMEQFTLRPGDFVNPMIRPAGLLIPSSAGTLAIHAGFGQIESQVIRPGMAAEVVCQSKPFQIIPMVVTDVQHFIASGQLRPTELLVDPSQNVPPGTLIVMLEPMFEGGMEGITPGSNCIANAYTSNHERLQDPSLGSMQRFGLHAIDTVGMVHAILLRIQALVMPIQTLVLKGH
ncbi:biotin/lipoyl-binding protein [Cereibacter sphaeroides]|uniref:HlyD family secretion protein n=1 Tax=Cereibacter sphaeroides TaxID=1063 RepID=UPI002D7F4172|nr:biotin/lipoyl-binding protein [Cereibacter sphaeroides]